MTVSATADVRAEQSERKQELEGLDARSSQGLEAQPPLRWFFFHSAFHHLLTVLARCKQGQLRWLTRVVQTAVKLSIILGMCTTHTRGIAPLRGATAVFRRLPPQSVRQQQVPCITKHSVPTLALVLPEAAPAAMRGVARASTTAGNGHGEKEDAATVAAVRRRKIMLPEPPLQSQGSAALE